MAVVFEFSEDREPETAMDVTDDEAADPAADIVEMASVEATAVCVAPAVVAPAAGEAKLVRFGVDALQVLAMSIFWPRIRGCQLTCFCCCRQSGLDFKRTVGVPHLKRTEDLRWLGRAFAGFRDSRRYYKTKQSAAIRAEACIARQFLVVPTSAGLVSHSGAESTLCA